MYLDIVHVHLRMCMCMYACVRVSTHVYVYLVYLRMCTYVKCVKCSIVDDWDCHPACVKSQATTQNQWVVRQNLLNCCAATKVLPLLCQRCLKLWNNSIGLVCTIIEVK